MVMFLFRWLKLFSKPMLFTGLTSVRRAGPIFRAVLVSVFLFFAQVCIVQAHGTDELLHQEALFHFYKNEYLETMVLLENDHVGSNHISNEFHNRNHLLALESGIRFGMGSKVDDILQHLEFTARENDIKQTAILYEGRQAYQRQQWRTAVSLFSEALKKKGLDRDGRDQALYYLANSYLKVNEIGQAAKVLGAITDGSIWAAYGYHNLGIQYAAQDPDRSRAYVALRVAAAMADESTEGLALKDRIQLAAGHIALEEQDYNKALSFLKNVRANGISAPAAIYDYGRAYAGLGRYRTAIQSWHRAKKFALVVPGVADTFQAIAFGYEKENLRATAIDAYLEAIAVYEKEIRQLDEIIDELGKNGALKLLVDIKVQNSGVEWFLATDLVTNTPTVAFVNFMMEDAGFYESAKELLQLQELRGAIREGQTKLGVFQVMLQKRAGEVGRTARKLPPQLDEKRLNNLVDERNAVAKAVGEADRSRDYKSFMPAQYASASERLQKLEQQFVNAGDAVQGSEAEELRTRLERLKGILLWQSMEEFQENRSRLLADMQSIDQRLEQLKSSFTRITDDLAKGRRIFDAKLTKVDTLLSHYQQLEKDLSQEIATIDQFLTIRGIELLREHQRSIDSYYVRSQLALVNLYDDLAIAEFERSQEKESAEAPL